MKAKHATEVRPLEPQEFARALLLGIAAGESDSGEPVVVDTPRADGTVEVLEVPDNPYSKAAFALRRHYLNDDDAFASALVRFRAFMNLLTRGALGPWARRRDGERLSIHPAALDVASQMRLSRNGRFAPRKFLQAVEHAAAANYPHLADW